MLLLRACASCSTAQNAAAPWATGRGKSVGAQARVSWCCRREPSQSVRLPLGTSEPPGYLCVARASWLSIAACSSGYTVNAQRGPDFVLCAVHPSKSGELPASLYIGNFPPNVNGLRFAAFTPSSRGQLAWFAAGSGAPRTWHTYISTGNPRSAVMVISIEARDQRDFLARAPRLSQLLIGASIAP